MPTKPINQHQVFSMARNRLYPHLLSKDISVWERYLFLFANQFTSIEYDVRVGKGRPADPGMPPNIRKMAMDLSQRRIDAVGFTEDKIYIIEITTRASTKAIGQLMMYPTLYQQTFRPALPLHPLLVCSSLESDVMPVLLDRDIDFVVV